MPSTEAITVLLVVVGTMALFIWQKWRVDLVALCSLVALLLLGRIDISGALSGIASPATATVAAMFVLSAGLVRTGLVDWLARHLDRLAGRSLGRLLLVLCLTSAALSAFVVNTAIVAVLIPVTMALAQSRRIPASRVLIPLSFASQFGGVCTLIGTSTNILMSTIAVENGLPPFGLFEFAPLGLVMSAIGVLYLLLTAPRMLPRRRSGGERVDQYRLADYLIEMVVAEDSPLIGQRWRDAPEETEEIDLIKLIRGDRASWRATATRMRAGDRLLLRGNVGTMMKRRDRLGLESISDTAVGDEQLSSAEMRLVEALVPPRSSLAGRTLRSVGFRRRYGCMVMAVQRRAKRLRERLADIHLQGGDTLLLQCEADDVARLLRSPDLIVTNEVTDLHVRADRALIALGMLVLMVGLTASGLVPIVTAALIGAVGMVLGGCLRIEEAYEAIDWQVIFLLAGVIPLGLALQQSGAAQWLAAGLLHPLVSAGPVAVLAGLYLTTAILTETMSNNAAAVLLAPLAISVALLQQVDPRPFLVAITFAASTSFATPIGYQTNTMIYAPGGYRFFDYTRIGGPLNLLFWFVAVLLIPRLWPF
ncbi:MAG: SLC13 family permease [Candidatus Eisenbacteria bacterium]|nr:SLC13 family permease [Candidatus Eisenbacteria bacterium]